jgi:hypothetical protein
MELIFYHDEKYPTSWISRDQSREIANYLKNRGFLECNAEELAEWMKKSGDKDTCSQSVVIFSQDVVPYTVCHSPSPSTLIRTYLDHGGSVIWIGDVPFYYIGPNPRRKLETLQDDALRDPFKVLKDKEGKSIEKWGRRGCFSVVGAVPVYVDFPISKVRLTKEAKLFGLKTAWYSNRPIPIQGFSNIRKKMIVLGSSKPHHVRSTKKARGYTEESEDKGVPLSSTMDLISKLLGLVSAAFAALAAGASAVFTGSTTILTLLVATTVFCLVLGLYWFLRLRETFASAWFKNFDTRHPSSGFVRIWDFSPDRITDKMLEELHNIAVSRVATDISSSKSINTLAKSP